MIRNFVFALLSSVGLLADGGSSVIVIYNANNVPSAQNDAPRDEA